ncbi:MAG: nucleotidyltransferase family protein, partial [Chloroflexi bacterium]|nr:nucleotidyltransferase family protein [Chloroflexota bacterium]
MDRLLGLLHHNKVPLLAINHQQGPLQNALCANPAFQAAQAAERSHYESLRQEYRAAQALWRQEGIEDVLIKSAGIFPSFPYKTSNLDALVRQCDGNRARQILRANGYVELRNVEENHKFLFRKFHQGEEVLGLHVHEHVGWYASFLDEASLWERRRPAPDDETLTIPSPEDALLITIAHSFYEDKNIKLSDLAKVHYCLRQKLDWAYIFQVAENRDWLDGLYVALLIYAHLGQAWYGQTPTPPSILTHAESSLPYYVRRWLARYLHRELLQMPFRIPFIFSKYYFYKRLWCNRRKGLAGRVADLFIHTLQGTKLRLHLHSQPAMLVSFSGIDGSGKTSQALTLQKVFIGCHIRVRYV